MCVMPRICVICCGWVACPEAYIASRGERELRELVRHRAKLVALRSGLKAQVHGVLAKVVGVGEHFLEGQPCLVESSGPGECFHPPEGAHREGGFFAGESVG